MTRIGIWYLCRRYETTGLDALYDASRSGRPREISAMERVSIEQLACSEPSGVGLEMTHWSTRSLAEIAMKRGLVSHIAHSTVSLILRNADLQPHRNRYWITPTLNAAFLEQASRILWVYERIEMLKAQNEIALALDEKPNIQALQRTHPTQPMRTGQIERQEFEYERHGVVNFLAVLNLYNGKMRSGCLEKDVRCHFSLNSVVDKLNQPAVTMHKGGLYVMAIDKVLRYDGIESNRSEEHTSELQSPC